MMKAVNLFGVCAALVLALALYVAKSEADDARDRLRDLSLDLASERGQVTTLKAEIAHLEDPGNLRALARQHLGFEPVRPEQEIVLSDLPRIDPAEAEAALAAADAEGEARVRRTGGRP